MKCPNCNRVAITSYIEVPLEKLNSKDFKVGITMFDIYCKCIPCGIDKLIKSDLKVESSVTKLGNMNEQEILYEI